MKNQLKFWVAASFACLFGLAAFSQTLPAPKWRCIQTIGTSVQLNWEQVPDPSNQFLRYEVCSLEDGIIAIINIKSSVSFVHSNSTIVRNYFIRVVDNTGSTDGVIHQNIRMNMTNPGNGTVLLSWNIPTSNISDPISGVAFIEREYPSGTWQRIDSVNNSINEYTDTVDICSAFLNYRISFPGKTCFSTSNVIGDNFEDKITPNVPDIKSVSIDTLSGKVQLNWNRNEQNDTYGYVIYKKDSNGFLIEIDTVWGVNNTFYSYNENTLIGGLTYSVAAFDSCFTQTVPPTYQTSAKASLHTSIFLNGAFNACAGVVSLEWSSYIGDGGQHQYQIFSTDSQGNWVSRGITNGTTYSVAYQDAGSYKFVVKAFDNAVFQSFSNVVNVAVTNDGLPLVNYILSANVTSEGVVINHLVDNSSNVGWIAFDRQNNLGDFIEIGRIPVNGVENSYLDVDARLDKVNHYRAVTVDSCGNRTQISDSVKTILLQVKSDTINYQSQLSWSSYEGFDGGVDRYLIYRGFDGQFETYPFQIVSASTFQTSDDLNDLTAKKSLIYKVVALEKMNQYERNEMASSNEAFAKFRGTLFIPNAFQPSGFNKRFEPVFSFQEYDSYTIQIYNRWAELVHQSNDQGQGWDGLILDSGREAQPGVYIYKIRFSSKNGEEKLIEGSLTLIR